MRSRAFLGANRGGVLFWSWAGVFFYSRGRGLFLRQRGDFFQIVEKASNLRSNERKVLGALLYHPTPDRLNLGYWRGEFGHLRGGGWVGNGSPLKFFEMCQSKVKLIGPGFFEIRS